MSTILVTGATGLVGTLLRPLLARPGRTLRLLDLVEPPSLRESEEVVVGSFTDPDTISTACKGVDLVVHLGGHSKERPWREIVEVNIDGTQTLLEAVRAEGVPRVMLASSIHAVGYLESDASDAEPVPHPRPDSYYGVGKVAVEALGSLYADRFGISIVSARIGTVASAVQDPRMLATWLSPADAARLVEAAAVLAVPGHHIVWGVSRNRYSWFDLAPGGAIGFEPADDAWEYADEQVRIGAEAYFAKVQPLAGPLIGPNYPLGAPWI